MLSRPFSVMTANIRFSFAQLQISRESITLVLPLVHIVTKNLTQLVSRDNISSPIALTINEQLKRFSDYNAHSGECSLYPAVRDILMNFSLPNEMSPGIVNQIVAPPMGVSPNPIMHSPMHGMPHPGNVGMGVPMQPYGGGM